MSDSRRSVDRDRFYVQRDRHAMYQRLSQDEDAPFRTMKDAWILSVALGYRASHRTPLKGGQQHVGFWHYLSSQEDVPFLNTLAVAETGDVLVLADRGEVLKIAEEYANTGIGILIESERHDRDSSLRSIAATIVSMTKVSAPPSTRKPMDDQDTASLVAGGESGRVEFKESARWNVRKDARDKAMEQEVLHAITGMLNGKGGTLLIGIRDDKTPTGLKADYRTLGSRQTRDGFEMWLLDYLESRLRKPPLAFVTIGFDALDGEDVCRIDVAPSPSPVYIDGDPYLYVRLGSSTRAMDAQEIMKFAETRWPSARG